MAFWLSHKIVVTQSFQIQPPNTAELVKTVQFVAGAARVSEAGEGRGKALTSEVLFGAFAAQGESGQLRNAVLLLAASDNLEGVRDGRCSFIASGVAG